MRALAPAELELVDARLPLSRLDGPGEGGYLVAWDGDDPVGHAHVAWQGHGGIPEIQDLYVLPERRRQGVASALTAAAEHAAAARGDLRVGLTVSVGHDAAQQMYRRLGYADSGEEPRRVVGTILIRGRPLDVDDTLIWLVKRL